MLRLRALRSDSRGGAPPFFVDATQAWGVDVDLDRAAPGNYFMPDLGRLQVDHLPAILARRGAVAPAYHRRPSGQAGLGLRPPAYASVRMSSSVDAEHLPSSLDGRERDRVFNTVLRHGIGCGGHFAPIHAIPSLRGLYRHRRDDFPLGEDPARSYPVLPFRNRVAGVAPGAS